MKQARVSALEFYAELRRETEAACCFFDGASEIWIPKSQILRLERFKGRDYEVAVPHWLAREKGII